MLAGLLAMSEHVGQTKEYVEVPSEVHVWIWTCSEVSSTSPQVGQVAQTTAKRCWRRERV